MSEVFDEIISGIGDEFHDPTADSEMLAVIDHARDIEWQLNMSMPTPEEIKWQITTLDKEWDQRFDEIFVASGRIYCAPSGQGNREHTLNGIAVISKGFEILTSHGDAEDGTVHYKVGHALLVRPQDILTADELADMYPGYEPSDLPYLLAFAPLDDIMLDSKDMTSVKAFSYITELYPELAVEVDRRINSTRDSLEAILALKDFDVTKFMDLNNETARMAFVGYVNCLIPFDHDCPLELVFDEGNIYASSTDEREMSLPIEVRKGDRLKGFVPSLIHFTEMHVDDEPSDDWTLAFDVYSITEDYREDRRTFCIPLDSLGDLQSTRAMFSEPQKGAQ